MKRWQKVLMILLSILEMIVAFYVITQFKYIVKTPFHFLKSINSNTNLYYIPTVLFWISTIVFIFSSLKLVLIVFYPKKEKQLKLSSTDASSLLNQKKAVESIILIKADEKDFFEDTSTKVIVKSKKNKISGKIVGSVNATPELTEKSKIFLNELQEDLEKILSLKSENIQLKLVLKLDKKKSIKKTTKKRVM
ncbi:alkaline shock response membrane anchor protein AmaP [Carnobacterium divergens]|uniref:alkaline shock response membrane anchor protein AmaP n=1 Tax=Carnobacterium divergens TaxID=2748 RepID=UPI001072997A|nr:alkaline shock response membrane anchor protein AmaP [Carnobacterium divergens]